MNTTYRSLMSHNIRWRLNVLKVSLLSPISKSYFHFKIFNIRNLSFLMFKIILNCETLDFKCKEKKNLFRGLFKKISFISIYIEKKIKFILMNHINYKYINRILIFFSKAIRLCVYFPFHCISISLI